MAYNADKWLVAVDLAGTVVFAVEGAPAVLEGSLDFLGILVLAFATALAGGTIRDLLIGAAPPQSIRDWRYAVVALMAGTIVFFTQRCRGRANRRAPLSSFVRSPFQMMLPRSV
jgi:uncharacterized membrane protein YeiH